MIAGQTSTYEGHQVALFPLDILNISQISGPDSYSHCCGNATDYVGSHYEYPVYAPFDCHLYNSGTYNRRMYVSDEMVWTLNGLQYVSVSFTHDNNPPSKTSFRQGELIAHSGSTGGPQMTGDHLHMDQSFTPSDPLTFSGITCRGGNACYCMSNSEPPEHVFYLTGDENVIYTHGLEFETWTGSPIYIKTKGNILLLTKKALLRKRGII